MRPRTAGGTQLLQPGSPPESLLRAGKRDSLAIIAAGPDRLRLQSESIGENALNRRPRLLQRLAGSRGGGALGDGKPCQAVPAFLQGRQHVRRMPIGAGTRLAL